MRAYLAIAVLAALSAGCSDPTTPPGSVTSGPASPAVSAAPAAVPAPGDEVVQFDLKGFDS